MKELIILMILNRGSLHLTFPSKISRTDQIFNIEFDILVIDEKYKYRRLMSFINNLEDINID